MINNRISDLSCDEEAFNRAKDIYDNALRASGYERELKFEPHRERNVRNRNRKVIWYNPPFCSHVKSDIGRKFLRMIDKHFPRNHRYAKIFNRSTIKISYSCMPNMATVIKNHNNRLLKPPIENEGSQCNCEVKPNCPLSGVCMTPCMTYAATVTADRKEWIYYGSTEGPFKSRLGGHRTSFRHRQYRNSSELSKHVWDLSDQGTPFSIKWSIVSRSHPYVCGSGRCDLCLSKKLAIARSNHEGMLNKRTTHITSRPIHMNST